MYKKNENIEIFKERLFYQKLTIIPAIIAIIVGRFFDNKFVYFIAILIFIGIVVFSLFNWRCPSCECFLGKELRIKFCNKCGCKLS